MRGLEIQLRTRSKVHKTKEGQALAFGFSLGPLQIFVIANMPEQKDRGEGPLVYIKLNLEPNDDWDVFREHYSTESSRDSRTHKKR